MTISIGLLADEIQFTAHSIENKALNENENVDVEQSALIDSLNRHGFFFTQKGIDIRINIKSLKTIEVLDQIINDACLNPVPKSVDSSIDVPLVMGTYKFANQVPKEKKAESMFLKEQRKDDRHLRVDARTLIEKAIESNGPTRT